MDNLIPFHAETRRDMKLTSNQRCVAPWGEFAGDNKEGKRTAANSWWDNEYSIHNGDSFEGHGSLPFKDAELPLCQDLLWRDYGQKQRRQAQSSSTGSRSSLSTTSSPSRQSVRIDTVPEDLSSSDSSGAPWSSNREYIKLSVYAIRKAAPIDNFWVRPEACCEALTRMANEVGLEPQTLEDDVPEASFWSMFQPSATSSPKTATPSPVLSSIKEQDEGKEYINGYESNRMLVAPPQTLAFSSQQDQLKDQAGSMEETTNPAMVYENESTAKITQDQNDAQTVELKQDAQGDLLDFSVSPEPEIISNVQEQVAEEEPKLVGGNQGEKTLGSMNDKAEDEEKSIVYHIQDYTMKEEQTQQNASDMKLSDIVQAHYQPKLKLSDLIEQPLTPAKHQQAPPPPSAPSHPPRPRMTLADLM
ncbi:hypothetical protein V8B55DRAFT_1558453 [Mucor lusitanicus]